MLVGEAERQTEGGGTVAMTDRDKIIGRLKIIRTWAAAAAKSETPALEGKCLEDVRDWTDDAIRLLASERTRIGRWEKMPLDGYTTLGGDPYFVCGGCGESGHVYGVENQKRKILCDGCGRINIYPYEDAFERGTMLWEEEM